MRRLALSVNRGFTLIEIMAVVFLIGLIATGATVMFNRGGPADDLDASIERFVLVAQRISDQAILSGEPMGLVLTPPEWAEDANETRWRFEWKRFASLPDSNGQIISQWQDLDGWAPVYLRGGIELFVRMNGSEWEWRSVPANDTPIFLLHPSGEADPYVFEIEFVHIEPGIEPQHVELDLSGRLQWREALEARAQLTEQFQ